MLVFFDKPPKRIQMDTYFKAIGLEVISSHLQAQLIGPELGFLPFRVFCELAPMPKHMDTKFWTCRTECHFIAPPSCTHRTRFRFFAVSGFSRRHYGTSLKMRMFSISFRKPNFGPPMLVHEGRAFFLDRIGRGFGAKGACPPRGGIPGHDPPPNPPNMVPKRI